MKPSGRKPNHRKLFPAVAVPIGTETTETPKPYDQLSAIMAYEQGDLDQNSTVELFQHLVDSGLAWQLQGHYGRTATQLIQEGYIKVI